MGRSRDLKRLVISQATQSDWREDLDKYLLMYRSTPHSTTQKTPAQMLFGRNIRDKIPVIHQPMEIDEETADIDKEKKEKGKQYADARRNAKESSIGKGDGVLVKRISKANKLSSNFEPEVYKVIERKGGDVTIAAESGKEYRRHISHLQKISDPDRATASSSNTIIDKAPDNGPATTTSSNTNIDKATKEIISKRTKQQGKREIDTNIQPRVTRSSKRPTPLKDLVIG